MRVALVTRHYAPFVGGIETHVAQLAKTLQENGDSVTVVCLADLPRSPLIDVGHTNIDGVSVRRMASHGLGESLRWPVRLVEPGSYDMVHFHGFSRALVLRLAWDCRHIPWVITPHGGIRGIFTDTVRLRRALKAVFDVTVGRRLLLRASEVVALTELEAEHLVSRLALNRSRITVIPNAVPRQAFDFVSDSQGTSNRLLTLSRLAPVKRIDDLFGALRLLQVAPGCDIAGPDGGELRRLNELSRSLPSQTVRFLGPVTGAAKLRLLRDAMALVLPSSLETLSMTALEAIAQGTPVIASEAAAAGLPQAAVLTFPVGDVRTLATHIQSFENEDFRQEMRARALDARKAILTDVEQADRIAQIYRKALRTGRLNGRRLG